MTNIILNKKEITTKSSKKQMQKSLLNEIEKIDNKLLSLGLPLNIKYIIGSSISNPESPQNTININTHTDINMLYRLLAYYQNIYNNVLLNSEKITKIKYTNIININGILISDIITDIELRIRVFSNQNLINSLNLAKEKLTPFLNEDTRLFNTIKEVENLYKSLL